MDERAMRWLVGLGLVVTLGCGQSSSDSQRSGGSGTGGAAGADGGSGPGGAGQAGGGPSGAGGAGASAGGSAGQAGSPGCGSPPWPGEECENGSYFCLPDERDFMACDPVLCATCDGFDGPEEQNGCRCTCNTTRTAVTCERI